MLFWRHSLIFTCSICVFLKNLPNQKSFAFLAPEYQTSSCLNPESETETLHNPYHFLKPTYSERAWQFCNLLNKQEVMAHRNDLGSGNCDAAWWRLIFRSTSKWMGRRKADSEWEWWGPIYDLVLIQLCISHPHTIDAFSLEVKVLSECFPPRLIWGITRENNLATFFFFFYF